MADGAALDQSGAARRMDAMYRHQRHIYDLTRKFYLFGRDRLLDRLPLGSGVTVLEMGCGTGRNLDRLARRRTGAVLHGADISSEMLATAKTKLAGSDAGRAVRLAEAAAHGFDPAAAFGIERFDVVYFSYVLSMIPDWRPAVERALALVKPGGILAVVDFGDQEQAPAWRRALLLGWLGLFHVSPRAEIERGLREIAAREDGLADDEDVMGGYAYVLQIRKA